MTSRLPPDYSLHDGAYQHLRKRGAIGWDGDDPLAYIDMFQLVSPALPALSAGNSPRVLEIGCGAGNFSVLLAKRGYTVTGVDISPTAIDWANERATSSDVNVDFHTDNVLALSGCADAGFDAVVDGHCLHCIIGDDRARCLGAVRRVLRSGGVFVVLTMCGDVTNERILQDFDSAAKLTIQDNRPTRYIGSAEEVVAEVSSAGFEITSSQVIGRKDVNDMDELVIHARKAKEV